VYYFSQNYGVLMNGFVDIQELVFVLSARKNSPAILSPEFLKFSGIVPEDWDLARAPETSLQSAQVLYRNGVAVVSQTDRLIFSEFLGGKDPHQAQISEVAGRYIERLPRLEYMDIGCTFRGFADCQGDSEAARHYLTNTLLQSGSWVNAGQEPVRASVNLLFTFADRQLNLSINEAIAQLPEREPQPVLLFTGSFIYKAPDEDTSDSRLKRVVRVLSDWRTDLNTYLKTVNEHFLGGVPSLTVTDSNVIAMEPSPASN
jgi:hypothetical protein